MFKELLYAYAIRVLLFFFIEEYTLVDFRYLVCFDSLRPSQRISSHVGTGLSK